MLSIGRQEGHPACKTCYSNRKGPSLETCLWPKLEWPLKQKSQVGLLN